MITVGRSRTQWRFAFAWLRAFERSKFGTCNAIEHAATRAAGWRK